MPNKAIMRSILLCAILMSLVSCGGSSKSTPTTPPLEAPSSNWDQLEWDQGDWG